MRKSPTDEAKRLCQALDLLGWTMATLADRSGYGRTTVKRWAAGAYDPPPALLAWLEARAGHMRDHPPPRKPSRWSDAA